MTTFYKDPLEQIIEELNQKNSDTLTRPLTAADLVFTEVKNNPATGDREVIAKAAQGAMYYGTIRNPGITYKRYLGHKLFAMAPRVTALTGDSHADIAIRLAEVYNLPPFKIQPSEDSTKQVYDLPFSLHSKTIEGDDWSSIEVTLIFEPDSIGYFGGITVNVYNAERDLAVIVANRALDSLTYPDNTNGEKGSLSTLTYPVTYTLSKPTLNVLAQQGQVVSSDENDPTADGIVDAIVNFYILDGSDESEMRAAMYKVVRGATVQRTNITPEGTTPEGQEGLVVLKPKADTAEVWVGDIYIRNPEFF